VGAELKKVICHPACRVAFGGEYEHHPECTIDEIEDFLVQEIGGKPENDICGLADEKYPDISNLTMMYWLDAAIARDLHLSPPQIEQGRESLRKVKFIIEGVIKNRGGI
jgi:hypothetical protein